MQAGATVSMSGRIAGAVPRVTVHWHALKEGHSDWQRIRCLYAYVAPYRGEILYIGKAWGVTVRGRWNRSAKEHFWGDLERDRDIHSHLALIGEIQLRYAGRLSAQLLADVETLLIRAERPWGNVQCRNRRIARPGLLVECVGEWPQSFSTLSG
jgi:hypothetical protein